MCRRSNFLHTVTVLVSVATLLTAACGGGDIDITAPPPDPPAPPPLVVTVAPPSTAVTVGETAEFILGIGGGGPENPRWTCSSSDPTVATAQAISTGCQATSISAGSATITAMVTKGSQTANIAARLTVSGPPPPPPPPLTAIITPPSVEVGVGGLVDFAVGTSGASGDASWTCTSSDAAVATVETTDTGCRATAVAAGGVTITAAITKGSESTNVAAQLTVFRATMIPAKAEVQVGGVVDFAVRAGSARWTCTTSDEAVATVAMTDTGCRVTGVGNGEATITAVVTSGAVTTNVTASVTVGPPSIGTARENPAGIGDTVTVRAELWVFNEYTVDLRLVLLDVEEIEPTGVLGPARPGQGRGPEGSLHGVATIEVTLLSDVDFYPPIHPLYWASWSIQNSGDECFFGFSQYLGQGDEPAPASFGTTWTEEVLVRFPGEASDSTTEVLALHGPTPRIVTPIGNCRGIDRNFDRPAAAWFLLR